MKKHLNKALAALLALVMVVALLPATAFAEKVGTKTYITTAAELSAAFGSTGVSVEGDTAPFTVNITGNVDLSGNSECPRIATTVTLNVAEDATLTLGDNTLIVDANGSNVGNLTITGKGTIIGTDGTIYVQSGSSLTIAGGIITNKTASKTTVYIRDKGSIVTMTGGTVTNETSSPAVNVKLDGVFSMSD